MYLKQHYVKKEKEKRKRQSGAPTVSECDTTVVNTNLRSITIGRCNVGHIYEQTHDIITTDYILSWSKHVCNTVIRPTHWSYTVQKQVIGWRSGRDKDTIHSITFILNYAYIYMRVQTAYRRSTDSVSIFLIIRIFFIWLQIKFMNLKVAPLLMQHAICKVIK